MDFDQIRAFINVASLKSFSAAAEKLFISQPSISVRIKALEEELGVILIDRSRAREPVLTEAGRLFLDYAQSIINLEEECRDKLSGQLEQFGGLVHVGASTVPGTYLLPFLLADFKKEEVLIDYNIDILDTSAVIEGVINYSYEIGFVGLTDYEERLKYISLIEDELVLCAKKDLLNVENKQNGVLLEDCFSQHLLVREKGSATRRLLERKLEEKGLDFTSFNGITYFNSLEGIKQAVRAGLGLAIVSKLSVEDMEAFGQVATCRILDLDLTRTLYMVHHKQRILNAAARRLRDFIIERFNRQK
ncbi:MAG: selenium metabolism-associated LysR family transcriptional regulator [Bacillota bacterium]